MPQFGTEAAATCLCEGRDLSIPPPRAKLWSPGRAAQRDAPLLLINTSGGRPTSDVYGKVAGGININAGKGFSGLLTVSATFGRSYGGDYAINGGLKYQFQSASLPLSSWLVNTATRMVTENRISVRACFIAAEVAQGPKLKRKVELPLPRKLRR
jgi:hypothetical protein